MYTDEVTFEGDIDHLTVYHFKPDYMLDNLRSNNYICHLSVFSAKLLAAVGGDERAAYNGSQDYDLYLRLTEKAHKIVHIPVSYTHLAITEISKVYGVSRPTISIKIKRITKFLKNFNFNATN